MESIIKHHAEQRYARCKIRNGDTHDEAIGLGDNAGIRPIGEQLISTLNASCEYGTAIIFSWERPSVSSCTIHQFQPIAVMGAGPLETLFDLIPPTDYRQELGIDKNPC